MDNQSRLDLPGGRKRLEELSFFAQTGSLLKRYDFHHSYFGSTPSFLDLRLKLDSIVLNETNSPLSPLQSPVYSFTYNTVELPSRDSKAIDYWGFYNGANNSSLIPYNFYYDITSENFDGGDRDANFEFSQAGLLEKITYPTGGSTTFHYEPNTVAVDEINLIPDHFYGSASLVGGEVLPENDPFNYNHSGCYDDVTTKTPDGTWTRFILKDEVKVKVNYFKNGNTQGPGPDLYFAAIYKSGTVDTEGTGEEQITGVWRDYCSLTSNPVEWSNTETPMDSITLEPAEYTIAILNSDPAIQMVVQVIGEYFESISEKEVGGVRIRQIVDDPVDGDLTTRRFYYGDLSNEDPSEVDDIFLAENSGDNGFINQNLLFEERHDYQLGFGIPDPTIYDCFKVMRSSANLINSNGPQITYPIVTEIQLENGQLGNGFTVHEFYNQGTASQAPFGFSLINGKKKRTRIFDNSWSLKRDVRYQLTLGAPSSNPGIVGYKLKGNETRLEGVRIFKYFTPPYTQRFLYNSNPVSCDTNGIPFYDLEECDIPNDIRISSPRFSKLTYDLGQHYLTERVIETWIHENGQTIYQKIEEESNEINFLLSTTKKLTNDGEVVTTKKYPYSTSEYGSLLAENRSGEEVGKTISVNGQETWNQKVEYDADALPVRQLYSFNGNALEERIVYNEFDIKGNPIEYKKDDLMRVVLWSYNYMLPVLNIANSTVAEVMNTSAVSGTFATIHDLIAHLQTVDDASLETLLRSIQSELNGQAHIFIHNPGVGLSKMIDVNGREITYEYDYLNRLVKVADQDENILSENVYNYGN